MNNRGPDPLAAWTSDRPALRGNQKAISDDLLQESRPGSSAGWNGSHFLVESSNAWGRNLWRRRGMLIFAAAWSVVSPAWPLLTQNFVSRLSSLDYTFNWRTLSQPWSTIDILGFSLMDSMLFIGLGVAIYSALHLLVFRKPPLRFFWKGFFASLAAFAVTWVCLYAIIMHYPSAAGSAVHWKRPTALDLIENFGTPIVLLRLPYFIGTLTALWFLLSREKPEPVRAA